jgi:tRNA(Ile)-lysidine synthase
MIFDTFKRTIAKHKLIEAGDKVLVAYSGGADSTTLLDLLLRLRQELGFEIVVAHFNHKLRPSSDDDEQFVIQAAQKYGLPLFVGSKNVRSYAKRHRFNLEEAGRKLRYIFLKKTAAKIGATKIATGHTMTDQAETLFMRLMRGSGPQGLSGIAPVSEGILIRPLIEIERQNIESYIKTKGLDFCVDETNFDRRLLRNRIRLDLLPYLQKNFEPKIVLHLGRLASIFQEEEKYLEKISEEAAQRAIFVRNGQSFIDRRYLSTLPDALARRCVRAFISRVKGDLRSISFTDVESVLNLGERKDLTLKKGLLLRREKDLVFLKEETSPKIPYEYSWKGKRPLILRVPGMKFRAQRLKKKGPLTLEFNDKRRSVLDGAKLKFPLLVRSRKEGDRYQPLGAPGQKKLKEIMRAKGIPVSEREKLPVFLSKKRIVWVLGLPVSERFKVRETTKDIFVIEKL